MSKMNIQGINNIDDPFYRYKMHKLNVVQQKNKVVIDNIQTICDDLKVEPSMLFNFFKKKFSISMHLDKNNVLSTTARITYQDCEKVLREFIEEVVLCKKCGLPELDITTSQNKISRICKSCSHSDNIKK